MHFPIYSSRNYIPYFGSVGSYPINYNVYLTNFKFFNIFILILSNVETLEHCNSNDHFADLCATFQYFCSFSFFILLIRLYYILLIQLKFV